MLVAELLSRFAINGERRAVIKLLHLQYSVLEVQRINSLWFIESCDVTAVKTWQLHCNKCFTETSITEAKFAKITRPINHKVFVLWPNSLSYKDMMTQKILTGQNMHAIHY